MSEYLENIRVLLEIDNPNMELVDLIKSFPIKLIDKANGLFNNSEFDLSIQENDTTYRIIKKYDRIRLSSSCNDTKKILDVYKCIYDDDIKSIADFYRYDYKNAKMENVMSDYYFIYGNDLISSIRSTENETITYTNNLNKIPPLQF